jgi:hypothetical protein
MGELAMTAAASERRYRSTESKYKGGARQMYVIYDLEQKTRGGQSARYHKVKRVYIAGEVRDWRTGLVRKETRREVHGLRIEYEQTRKGYRRRGYAARQGETKYLVAPRTVSATAQRFTQVVEIPTGARNVHFYSDQAELPPKYEQALQEVR